VTLAQGTYVDHLLEDAARFAAAVERGPLDAAVGGCPGWTLADLTSHLGVIHRWARASALTAQRPEGRSQFEPPAGLDAAGLAAWLRTGAAELADVLRGLDPAAPTWHPFLVERVAGLWPRRQAHETSVHRWDAERAIGEPSPIDPTLASDGIDEFFELVHPRAITREQGDAPAGSLHVHCTDVAGEWLAWYDGDGYHFTREHAKGDAALRGPAEQLLLALYHREYDTAALSQVGDEAVAAAWLGAPGL
jgi:uncharacterized protein (TIGR03083 family)